MPAVDLTSTWIPLGILGVLVLYMIHLFLQERRVSRELLAADAIAPVAAAPVEAAPVAAPAVESAVEPAPAEEKLAVAASVSAEEKPKVRRSLVWRTAWIWLPVLVGVGGQAYLDHRPLIDPPLHKLIAPLLQMVAS